MSSLKLGTRGSQLALYQANTTASLLQAHAGIDCEIVVIRTSGDRLSEAPLSEIGGKRLFVKEIEDSLIAGEIDLAVHSSKDLPAALPPGLTLGAVLPREDPRDAVVLSAGRNASSVDEVRALLGSAPKIGTSSVRRIAQLIALFPGARFEPIRGNLDTRLRKLDSGDYDALVLAAAGLRRLQHAHRISTALPAETCVPAPGQGIIAIEIREDDQRTRELVTTINDATASVALDAERAVVTRLGGGCQMPIGAYATVEGETMILAAVVIALDGSREVRGTAAGSVREPGALGIRVADSLLTRGADTILADAQKVSTETSEQP
jgi:hydroxymethylbilane synthase